MSEEKVFLTEEELSDLKLIQSQKLRLNEELAAISLAEFELKNRKQAAESYYNSIKELEARVVKEMGENYGAGRLNVNLETGEILPE
jgi:hypothetical protein